MDKTKYEKVVNGENIVHVRTGNGLSQNGYGFLLLCFFIVLSPRDWYNGIWVNLSKSAAFSPLLQTAQCQRPEENVQPLSGIVILPSRLPQHFGGLRGRQELLCWPRDLIFIFFFFEQQYFPGFVPVLCGPSALPSSFFASLAP